MNARSIFANYLGSTFAMALSKGLRFSAIVLCIRMVGDQSWGEVVSTIAIFSFISLLVDQGLSASPLLFRLHDRGADARLFRMITSYRLLVSILIIASIHAFHVFVAPVPWLARMYSFVLIPRALGVEWWFQRRELFQVTTYIALVKVVVFLGLAALLVRPGSSASLIIALELVSDFASLLFAYGAKHYCRDSESSGMESPPFGFTQLLLYSLPFMLMMALNTVQTSIDVVFLKFFFGPESVAKYDIGNKISFLYFYMGVVIVQIIRPKLTMMNHSGNRESIITVLRAASGFLAAFDAFVMLPSLHFAPDIIRLLFGKADPLSVFVFRWAAIWVGVAFAASLLSETLLGLGRRRKYLNAAILCGMANIAANISFMHIMQAEGVIIAKIVADVVFVIACIVFIPTWLRKAIIPMLGFQVAVMLVLLAGYLGAELVGGRVFWIALSVVIVAVLGRYSGMLSRRTLATFMRH